MKIKTITLAVGLGMLALAASAAPVRQAGQSGNSKFPPPIRGSVLYSQLDNPAGNGAPDQDFEAAFDIYDSEAADDFEVTDANGWVISGVNTVGTTGLAGGATVDVTFYTNAAGGGDTDLPGTAICTYPALVPADTTGSFVITLPTTCEIPQGRAWVGIQTNQDFGTNGQHFWSNRTVQTLSESVFRNPGDGFATGCTAFTPQTVCGVGGGASPDLLFSIEGTVGVPATADLSITKTRTGNATVEQGGNVTFTLAVGNAGPANATGVVVTDTLPLGLRFVSSTCGATAVGQVVTWNVGALANAGTANCTLVTRLLQVGNVTNSASVTGTNGDPVTANNTATAGVTGLAPIQAPTLSTWSLLALLAGSFGIGMLVLRRR